MRSKDFVEDHSLHNWELITKIWEEFIQDPNIKNKHINLKKQAANYLDLSAKNKLSKKELRSLIRKTKKLKISNKKEERFRKIKLAKQIERAYNL